MPEIILSILICSLHKRFGMLGRLLGHLEYQIVEANAKDKVEVLVKLDSGERSTGRKRDELLREAKGRMVVFIDDDDLIDDEYVAEILKAANSDPDAIGINGTMTTDGHNPRKWFISKELPYRSCRDNLGNEYFERYNNHLSPVRRSIALQIGFPDQYQFEDFDYAKRLHESGLIKTEAIVEKPIYHYKFMSVKK